MEAFSSTSTDKSNQPVAFPSDGQESFTLRLGNGVINATYIYQSLFHNKFTQFTHTSLKNVKALYIKYYTWTWTTQVYMLYFYTCIAKACA